MGPGESEYECAPQGILKQVVWDLIWRIIPCRMKCKLPSLEFRASVNPFGVYFLLLLLPVSLLQP